MLTRESVLQLSAEVFERVKSYRRHLHANPELSFKEYNTSAFICSVLEQEGIPFQTGFAGTGITALIGENAGPVIALRADMDALPIIELNDVEYKSKNEGIMHACGHDVHSASLLGAALVLNRLKKDLPGKVKLVFQPGEEVLPGGASLMLKEGALNNPWPGAIFGQHVHPEIKAGEVGFCPGPYMASTDEIYVTVKGKGGHAALPHRVIDPVLISAHLIVALQQIVSRSANPIIPSVLSFGKVQANGATNIIPDEVKMEGTFRTFNEDWRAEAHIRMKALAEQLAISMGGSCDFVIERGYPFLVNHETLTLKARKFAQELLGETAVIDLPQRMTAEDFAYYSQVMPACFYRLGTSSANGNYTAGLHNARFNIDESALLTGTSLMSWLAIRWMQEPEL